MTVRKAGSVWDCDRFLSIVRREYGKSWLAKQAIMNWKGKSKAVDGWYRFCYIVSSHSFTHLSYWRVLIILCFLFSEKRTKVCTANLMSAKSNKACGCGSKRKHLCVTMQTAMAKESSKYPVFRTAKESLLQRDGIYYYLHSFRLMDTDRRLANQQHLDQGTIQFDRKHG